MKTIKDKLVQIPVHELLLFSGHTFASHDAVKVWLLESYQRVIAETIKVVHETPYEVEPEDLK